MNESYVDYVTARLLSNSGYPENIIKKEIIRDDKKYALYKRAGWEGQDQILLSEIISRLNNKKAIVVTSAINLYSILPENFQYRHILTMKEDKYFETNWMGFHVTTNPDIFKEYLSITDLDEGGNYSSRYLFIVSVDDNKQILNNIGCISLS